MLLPLLVRDTEGRYSGTMSDFRFERGFGSSGTGGESLVEGGINRRKGVPGQSPKNGRARKMVSKKGV